MSKTKSTKFTVSVKAATKKFDLVSDIYQLYTSESWSNWTPAFDDPFVPKITAPTRVNSLASNTAIKNRNVASRLRYAARARSDTSQ
jgi:hypothetical protein